MDRRIINQNNVGVSPSPSVVQEALSTVQGEQVFLNVIKANRASIRNILS